MTTTTVATSALASETGKDYRGRLLRSFPVTTVFLLQVLFLFVIAPIFDEPGDLVPDTLPYTISMLWPVAAGIALAEALVFVTTKGNPAAKSWFPSRRAGVREYPYLAPAAAGLMIAAWLAMAWLGFDSYISESSVRETRVGQLVNFLGTVQWVATAACLLEIKSGKHGTRGYWLLGGMALAVTFFAIQTGGYVGLASFGLSVVITGLIIGVWRPIVAVVVLLIGLLLSQPAIESRNQFRSQYKSYWAESTVDGFNRVRQDNILLQSASAISSDLIEKPTPLVLLRYSVPKFLDPNRPPIPFGRTLNQAVGGSTLSFNTFTGPGNAIYLYGKAFAFLFYGLVALAIHYAVRRANQIWWMTVAFGLVASFVSFTGSFPLGIPGFFQNLFYAAMWLGIWLLSGSLLQLKSRSPARIPRDQSHALDPR